MKVAVITGASSGIGRALALALSDYRLALVGRRAERLREIAKEQDRVYPIDLSRVSEVESCTQAILEDFGDIDLLFNSAGVLNMGTLELSVEQFEEMLNVNLRAPFLFMKFLVPAMRPGAHVVNVASRSGKIGFAGAGGYSASKFGLNGLNEAVYRACVEKGVKVTSLCPSWVDTPMASRSGLAPEDMIQPEDLNKTVRWLLSLSPAACVKEVVLECARSIH